MAWMKCKYCNKRISDKVSVCPKCNKKLVSKNRGEVLNLICAIFSMVFLIVLNVLLVRVSEELLYSGVVQHIFIILGICFVLFVSNFIMSKCLINKYKGLVKLVFWLIVFGSFVISVIYCIKSVNAFRYDNSLEILKLSEKYSIKDSKKLKKEIEKIFEYDYDNISSRDVIISSYYDDEEVSVLYLDDSYKNYRLKFYVIMKDNSINDLYWEYNDDLLYLVEDGQKTENFEYYYAMYIITSVIGEDINGLATIDQDIENKVNKRLGNFANAMFSYDLIEFDDLENVFLLECSVDTMDYYGNMENVGFTISFTKRNDKSNKKIWYYGDSSFDYVNWNVNI